MSQSNSWKRTSRIFSGTNLKRWYKKFVHRRDRRKAKQNPENRDKPLDPWELD
jgi:hypothetical protein